MELPIIISIVSLGISLSSFFISFLNYKKTVQFKNIELLDKTFEKKRKYLSRFILDKIQHLFDTKYAFYFKNILNDVRILSVETKCDKAIQWGLQARLENFILKDEIFCIFIQGYNQLYNYSFELDIYFMDIIGTIYKQKFEFNKLYYQMKVNEPVEVELFPYSPFFQLSDELLKKSYEPIPSSNEL